MTTSNYPSGFMQGVAINGIPIQVTNPGKVFWLYNGTVVQKNQRVGQNSNHGTFNDPFGTLAYALTQCVANRGDTIFVKAGHAENIAANVPATIAGVTVIGLGSGTLRPNFTFTTINTNGITVSADNNTFQNCIFTANFLSIAACFTLTTAKFFTVSNCDFVDTNSTHNFLNIVKSTGVANTVDGLTFNANVVKNLGVTSNNTTILTANDIDRLTITNNYLSWAIQNDKSVACIVTAGALTNLNCGNNIAMRPNTSTTGGFLINVGSASTGVVYGNLMGSAGGTDLVVTGSSGLFFYNNYITAVGDLSGYLLPVVDS